MCYYITATLPKETDISSLRELLKEFNMRFKLVKNKNLESQLRPGELYLRTTQNYCDCDSVLGSQNRSQEYEKLLNSKKVKTLRKKKWSEDQIDDWILERIYSKTHKKGSKKTALEINEEIDNWINFIKKLLKEVKRVGLLKHWYYYNLENEEIALKKTEQLNVKDLAAEKLLMMEEDVLYEFIPSYPY
ncbi:MAG: hypothetical protein ACFE8G_14970 [Candidatus Hermodarchaeota archaeon]